MKMAEEAEMGLEECRDFAQLLARRVLKSLCLISSSILCRKSMQLVIALYPPRLVYTRSKHV